MTTTTTTVRVLDLTSRTAHVLPASTRCLPAERGAEQNIAVDGEPEGVMTVEGLPAGAYVFIESDDYAEDAAGHLWWLSRVETSEVAS